MDLRFYNSLTKNNELFTPLSAERVTLYTCGPTVYDYAHIGNFRAYLFGDILKRTLLFNGFTVLHIMNITDIDDKTIKNSQREGKSLTTFTEFYTEKFYEDRDRLNILPPSRYTKATNYILEMLRLIEQLIEKGFAYKALDGSIYFKISSDTKYGQLVEIDITALKENAQQRMKADEYEKDSAQDFALWKAWDENDGDVFWEPAALLGRETVLVKGRPGWHIECSAMSMSELGETIDIHTGGIDNMFPHHENEIAQSECATGTTFVKYWMHNGWLLVDGKKMAKSAGNFYTLRNVIEKGYNPLSFRLLTLQTHYKSPLNFTWEGLTAADTARERLLREIQNIKEIGTIDKKYEEAFLEAINDDLNTPKALSVLFTLLSDSAISAEDKKATALHFDKVFGLRLDEQKKEILLPEKVVKLLELRQKARDEKDWHEADMLRIQIKHLGYEVLDTENGQEIK